MRSYKQIMIEIHNACCSVWNSSSNEVKAEVVESATKIYLKELELEFIEKKQEAQKTTKNQA